MRDMVKFWKTTDKPSRGMKQALKLSIAPQGETGIDGTTAVNPVIDKRVNKSEGGKPRHWIKLNGKWLTTVTAEKSKLSNRYFGVQRR